MTAASHIAAVTEHSSSNQMNVKTSDVCRMGSKLFKPGLRDRYNEKSESNRLAAFDHKCW
jgi:hypothetical protein